MNYFEHVSKEQPRLHRLMERASGLRILAIGAINYDEIFLLPGYMRDDGATHVSTKRVLAGGHAGNAAAAFAKLGVRTSLAGAVGDDGWGAWLLQDLAHLGVDTSMIRITSAPTGRVIIPVFQDAHFMILERGANETPCLPTIDEYKQFDAIALFDPSTEVFDQLLALSFAGWNLPPIYWTPGGHYCDHPIVAKLLPLTHCVFMNAAETERVQRTCPHILAGNHRPWIVQTCGADGSIAHADGKIVQVPGFRTDCVDPTGAGDLFAACFIVADLAGLSLADSLCVANAGGMIAVETVGARSPVFCLDLLAERLLNHGGPQ